LSAWVKLDGDIPNGDFPRIISKGNYNSYHLRMNDNRSLVACFSRPSDGNCDGNAKTTLDSGTDKVRTSKWVHIVGVWDGMP
jgi:hypothetical protein